MNHKERFYATIERRPVDYPASWLGLPVAEACNDLFDYFRVSDMKALKRILGDDVFPVEAPYRHPPANHIACAFDFAKKDTAYEDRTLTASGFFENYTDPKKIDEFEWPVPSEHMSYEECGKAIDAIPEDYAIMAMMWSAHFQDACAAFGMETALMKMLTEPEIFRAVIDRITDFYIDANCIFYEAAKGKIDAVLIGNDLGTQNGLMISPDLIKEFILPGTRRLVEQARSYGFKVIHHSCGAVFDIIPELIDIGVDAIHPIQSLARGMNPEKLKEEFGNDVSFCGGVDVQDLLVHGTPDEVRNKITYLKKLFPTGLIISPSHEAVLPDVKPQNIEAFFNLKNY